jgi:hypothetical protein
MMTCCEEHVNTDLIRDLKWMIQAPAAELSMDAGIGPRWIRSLATKLAAEMARLNDKPEEAMKILDIVNGSNGGNVFDDLWRMFRALDPDYKPEVKAVEPAKATVYSYRELVQRVQALEEELKALKKQHA